MLHLGDYLHTLRARLRSPAMAVGEVRKAALDITGISLSEEELSVVRGVAYIDARPEKRIAILSKKERILGLLKECGVGVDDIR